MKTSYSPLFIKQYEFQGCGSKRATKYFVEEMSSVRLMNRFLLAMGDSATMEW